MNLEDLKKELPYKWRVQSTRYGKTTCVAYIDARDCMDILDEVCGPENWQSMFYEENGLLFCKVGIFVKRACVKWGIGRFLYRLSIQTLTTKQYKGKDYPYAPEKDKIIFDGDTLTKYINWKIKNNK